jgi:formamidopyrimidine-DNA glycosylase
MPELPEVEAAAVRLRGVMVGRTVRALIAHHPSQRRQLTKAAARRAVGRAVVRVERRGKHQLLHLDDGALLHVHFRMNGDWEFTRVPEPLPRFARVTFDLDDGSRVSLTDSRALCSVRYHVLGHPPALALGPEADDPLLTASALRIALAGKRGAIKPALLDQRVIAGIGNIYAGEALWRARISPLAPAAALSLPHVKRLLVGLRTALADGVKNAGRYGRGERVAPFKVYDREGEKCKRCGKKVRRVVQAGRSTYYCANCQN